MISLVIKFLIASQLQCLAETIYYEARSDNLIGKQAVADVVINRVLDDRFPEDICSVVYQKKQFSWTADKYSITELEAWKEAESIAVLKLKNILLNRRIDRSQGALYFSKGYHHKGTTKIGKIGKYHIFFK